MRGKLQHLLLAFLICSFSGTLMSQKSLIKAKKHFELKAFDLAIENAKKALKDKPECVECHSVIAESFRMMNANVDAAIWYRKMEKLDNLPQDYAFNYALLLKRMGQYNKAKKYFESYAGIDQDLANLYAESCDFAKAALSGPKDFELNLYNASSKVTDYGPTFFRDKIVFSSFRTDFKRSLDKLNNSQIQDQHSQLFIGNQGVTGTINNVDFLLSDDEETFDYGPIHYAAEANVVAVTKNNFRDGEKQIFSNDLELALYTATSRSNGSFHNLEAFPYNEVGYATGFGTLNPSGNIMYFASNRPGGKGGFDLYVSYYKNGKWTYPENLGDNVNTPGNEITPFFDGETLYFSSDYWMGLGGFDVFKTNVSAGEWNVPANLGNGVNSPEDDYYFTKHPERETFYLTSNRLGGRGSHDIYIVNKAAEEEQLLSQVVDYEDVVPAAVSIEKDIIEDRGLVAETQNVNLEESIPNVPKSSYSDLFNTDVSTENIIEETSNISDRKSGISSDLASGTQDNETTNTDLNSNNGAIDFNKILPPKAVDLNKMNAKSISLAGAKRVAYGEIIRSNSNVYFIQVAALFKSQANMNVFSGLKDYGSLYKFYQSSATKVKLGYFLDEYQAKDILRKVKSMGYSDAFITYEPLNTASMELVELPSGQGNFVNINETTGISYKVRLASYEDPIWFDINKVNGMGTIEQWSKGEWTIFVLSGFASQSEAQIARDRAIAKGFSDAEVVIDRNGILENLN